jgi:hypothetical protein
MPVAAAKVAASWVPPCRITTRGHGAAGIAGRDIEPVGPGTGSVGVREGVKPARWSFGGRRRGPVCGAGIRCAAAGGSAETANPAGRDLPQRCPLVSGWREGGRAGEDAAGLFLGAGRIRPTPGRPRTGQGLLYQRGCLDEAPLAGQAGGIGHRRHLACIHDGIPSRGCRRRPPVWEGGQARTPAGPGTPGRPW